MKKLLSLGLLFSITFLSFSQDELDGIFDDGAKESKFYIGTNLNTIATGTLNIYGDYYPVERFRITAGLGLIPFNTHRDYTFAIPFESEEIDPVYENLSGGTFSKLGFAFLVDSEVDFSYYYYLNFNRKQFSINQDDKLNIKQLKISSGAGYLIGLKGRFNLDIQAGLVYGSQTKSFLEPILDPYDYYNPGPKIIEYSDVPIIKKGFAIGFELNFGINYAL